MTLIVREARNIRLLSVVQSRPYFLRYGHQIRGNQFDQFLPSFFAFLASKGQTKVTVYSAAQHWGSGNRQNSSAAHIPSHRYQRGANLSHQYPQYPAGPPAQPPAPSHAPFQQGPTPPYFAPGQPPKKKKKKWPWIVGAVVVIGAFGSAAGGGNEPTDSSPAAAVEASKNAEDAAAQEAEKAAAEKAAADKAEAEKAAAEKAAADKAEAARVAAAKKEAAAKAAAEKAAAEKAKRDAQARIANATEKSPRDLSLVAKNPDAYLGQTMVVYANITQFDAATGKCTFRANIAHTVMAQSYEYEHNSIFTGGDGDSNCPALADFVTDDQVRITATSMGSFSYDTQIGGNTTVPMFKVENITLIQ
ncbi:hypothetical protein ACIP9X_13125 [Arthrobacter sp. NPDC093125]|uniref:hypothetical protein n=1 Tax=Arthrobacter sp. NPDC093125 TaxID=3363944 RepID=UPI0038087B7A